VVDTLRADHLGCYGYPEAQTYNIDKLASSGILISDAVSHIPETGPSFSSLFTSLHPISHGHRDNTVILNEKHVTLAEVLKRNGFRTAAFTDTFPFDGLHLLQGFDERYERFSPEYIEDIEKDTRGEFLEEVSSWLKETKDECTFTLIHFFEPHMPYYPRNKSKKTRSYGYDGLFDGSLAPVFGLWLNKVTINENDREYMTSLYDDEISTVDATIGQIVKQLEKLNIDKDTLVVFTSDHGESLGDHGYYFDHGDYLYEHQIHIPLIIRHSSFPMNGVTLDAQVRHIDIMPTILHILGIKHHGKMEGVSFLPILLGKKKIIGTQYAFSESDTIDFKNPNNQGYIEGLKGKHFSLRKKDLKLIYIPKKPGGEFELYDLSKDPFELNNIIGEHSEGRDELKHILFKWLSQKKGFKRDQNVLSDEALKILKSLGYIH
jgi:arylsulfatase A-like enzyme